MKVNNLHELTYYLNTMKAHICGNVAWVKNSDFAEIYDYAWQQTRRGDRLEEELLEAKQQLFSIKKNKA